MCIFIRNGVRNEVLIFSDVFTELSKDDFFLLGEKGSGRVKIALGCEALDSDPQQIRFSHPKLREFIGFYRFLGYDSYNMSNFKRRITVRSDSGTIKKISHLFRVIK